MSGRLTPPGRGSLLSDSVQLVRHWGLLCVPRDHPPSLKELVMPLRGKEDPLLSPELHLFYCF